MDSASALCCLKMAHETNIYSVSEGRLYTTDNIYTRHVLEKQLQILTDNDAKMFGTGRFNNVDVVNSPGLKSGMKKLGHLQRRSWVLVYVLDKSQGNITVA